MHVEERIRQSARRASRHLGSNAVAYAALFFALTGSAVAAKPLITGADIKDESIEAVDIKDGSIIGPEIADKGISSGKLAHGSIIGPEIAANAIESAHVASDSLTGDDIDESTLDLGGATEVSLAALAGTACTTFDGTAGAVQILTTPDNTIELSCAPDLSAAKLVGHPGNVTCFDGFQAPGKCVAQVDFWNAGTKQASGPLSVSVDPSDWETVGDTCSGASLASGGKCSVLLSFTAEFAWQSASTWVTVQADPGGMATTLVQGRAIE